jgi:hypothetical protein
MNDIDNDLEILLDRLVDGDLERDEYRRLLLDLEEQPGGWRRCALAFLQAQALRREFQSKRQPYVAHGAHRPLPTTQPLASRRRRLVELVLAAAAGILIALPVGLLFPGSSEIATMPAPDASNETVEDVEAAPPEQTDQEEDAIQDWPPEYEWVLSEEGSAFPAGLARALESVGTRVRRERGLLPLETRDGRRFMVPIERVELTPVTFAQYR